MLYTIHFIGWEENRLELKAFYWLSNTICSIQNLYVIMVLCIYLIPCYVSCQENDAEDKKLGSENSLQTMCVQQSSSSRDKRNAGLALPLSAETKHESQPPATNPPCPATEDCVPNEDNPPTMSVIIGGWRSCATDNSDGDSGSDVSDCQVERNEIRHSSNEITSVSKQVSPSSNTEKDCPTLSTIHAGILPCPMAARASGKIHDQWEIPLSFHPHVIPTSPLASGWTALAPAIVQGKATAPRAKLTTNAPQITTSKQEMNDLLAQFATFQPLKKPPLGLLSQ